MSESARPRWGWRCVGQGCGARERTPGRTEAEVAGPAEAHSRETGHVVSWGLLIEGRLR